MASLLSRLSPTPHFPAYKGTYEVGTLDLELPVSQLIDAGLSPPCPAHSDIPTIQFRVFYPAALKGQATGTCGNGVNWIPSPRKEYVAAYCRFAGAGEFLANLLSYIPRHLYHITLPAYANHALLESPPNFKFPVVVFSHGLGGTRNTYSYLTASLAAQGCVVFCPEHRDGSAPVSFIREPGVNVTAGKGVNSPATPSSSGSGSDGEETSSSLQFQKGQQQQKINRSIDKKRTTTRRRRIDYISQPHEISPNTAAIRNKQLEIRLWELGALFAVIRKLNSGYCQQEEEEEEELNDVYVSGTKNPAETIRLLNMFKDRLDVSEGSSSSSGSGSITWIGHSFGAATITQFIKSCWYAPLLLQQQDVDHHEQKQQQQQRKLKEPLYNPAEYLLRHFHPDGTIGESSRPPVTVLLDTWCLPLLGERTRALWKLPLPGPTLGVFSLQFYKWKENLRGFRHVMSHKGGSFEREWFKDGQDDKTPTVGALSTNEDDNSNGNSSKIGNKLRRTSSLDVTPQLPTGFRQGDEEKLNEVSESAIESPPPGTPIPEQEEEEKDVQNADKPLRRFYYATNSAHMSQSDFGILFPRSARCFMRVDDSERVLDLNVRAITEFLREAGKGVAGFGKERERDLEIFGDAVVDGWGVAGLELGDEGLKLKEKGDEEMKGKEGGARL